MLFSKKKKENDLSKELLRENLKLVSLNMFYLDDPLDKLEPEQRMLYLKTFYDMYTDQKVMDRIKYHINKQAHKTLEQASEGIESTAGALNINGMAFIFDDIESLAKKYMKEKAMADGVAPPIDRFSIIPKVDGSY
jgi:hypothetical protein